MSKKLTEMSLEELWQFMVIDTNKFQFVEQLGK